MKERNLIVLLIIIKLATSQSVYSNSSTNSTSKYGEKRFDEWTWLTAHNSHLNWPDSSVIYIASNQNLSIDEQLKYGVRGFMFDVDYHKCSHLSSLLNSCNCEGVCLCHGQCSSNSLKDGFAIKSLGYALRKLVNFLTKNKEEIITVFLEDYIQTTTQLTNVFDRIKNLNRMIFNPYAAEWNVLEKGWPKISDMVKANKRLLIIDDEQRAYHVNRLNGIIRSRDYLIQNHYEWLVENKTILPLPSTSSLKDISKLAIEDPKHFLIHLAHMNKTLSIPIAKCVSVHSVNRRPNWGETHKLNLTSREHPNQLLNGQRLFLFNHFYGVPAKGAVEGNLHLYEYINSREFVEKRLREKCDPNTSGKKPNYIALDFIEEQTFDNLITHFNTNKY